MSCMFPFFIIFNNFFFQYQCDLQHFLIVLCDQTSSSYGATFKSPHSTILSFFLSATNSERRSGNLTYAEIFYLYRIGLIATSRYINRMYFISTNFNFNMSCIVFFAIIMTKNSWLFL